MGQFNTSYLASFWSPAMIEAKLLVVANLVGALLLGLLVG